MTNNIHYYIRVELKDGGVLEDGSELMIFAIFDMSKKLVVDGHYNKEVDCLTSDVENRVFKDEKSLIDFVGSLLNVNTEELKIDWRRNYIKSKGYYCDSGLITIYNED